MVFGEGVLLRYLLSGRFHEWRLFFNRAILISGASTAVFASAVPEGWVLVEVGCEGINNDFLRDPYLGILQILLKKAITLILQPLNRKRQLLGRAHAPGNSKSFLNGHCLELLNLRHRKQSTSVNVIVRVQGHSIWAADLSLREYQIEGDNEGC